MHRISKQGFIPQNINSSKKRPISSPNQRVSPSNSKNPSEINYINNVNQIQVNNIQKNITYNIYPGNQSEMISSQSPRNLIRSEQFKVRRKIPGINIDKYRY